VEAESERTMSSEDDDARVKYLEAGKRILDEARPWRALTWQKIADGAGKSPNAAQKLWGYSKERYLGDLLRYTLSTERFWSVDGLQDLFGTLQETDELVAATKQFLREDFRLVRDDPASGMLLLLLGGKPDRSAQAGLRRLYHEFDAWLVPLLDEVFAVWHREPVPPLTTEDVAIIFNSIVDGMTIRARIDDRVQPELYATTILCLVPMLTRECESTDRLDDRFALLDEFRKRDP
jgi:hypothetical protein